MCLIAPDVVFDVLALCIGYAGKTLRTTMFQIVHVCVVFFEYAHYPVQRALDRNKSLAINASLDCVSIGVFPGESN